MNLQDVTIPWPDTDIDFDALGLTTDDEKLQWARRYLKALKIKLDRMNNIDLAPFSDRNMFKYEADDHIDDPRYVIIFRRPSRVKPKRTGGFTIQFNNADYPQYRERCRRLIVKYERMTDTEEIVTAAIKRLNHSIKLRLIQQVIARKNDDPPYK